MFVVLQSESGCGSVQVGFIKVSLSVPSDQPLLDREDKRCLLLDYVLDCLHKIFLYDTHRFLSKERADALMLPLVEQVRRQLSTEFSLGQSYCSVQFLQQTSFLFTERCFFGKCLKRKIYLKKYVFLGRMLTI